MDASQYTRLMEYLEQLPDPRQAKGRQYPWRYLLGLVAAGTAAGCRGPLAIWEWACHHRAELAAVWGLAASRIPSESTLQRVLRNVDLERVEALIEAHNLELEKASRPDPSARAVLSLDGKWVRTASAHGEAVVLLGLCSQRSGVLLRQRRVPAGTNEEGFAPAFLDGLDLRGCLVTMDAGLTSQRLMVEILAGGGDYLMVVKRDTMALYQAITELFAVPSSARFDPQRTTVREWHKGHGRLEYRAVTASSALQDWLDDWPRPGLVLRRETQRTNARTGQRGDREVTYALCSLSASQTNVAELAAAWRGHWGIENKVHYIRDVSLGEDRCAVWRGAGPQFLAALRNGLLATIRSLGCWESVPSAMRWAAASPIHAMQLVGLVSTMT